MTPDEKKWVRLLLHDLRNPLAEIQTGIQIRKMRKDNFGSADDSFLDDSILESVRRMSLLMDMIQMTVSSGPETDTFVEVSIPEILSHFPLYLGRKEMGFLRSCHIEHSGSSIPVLIIPDFLDQVLTGLVLFAHQVKMENSVTQLYGKMNQIYLSWKDTSPDIYTNSLFTENGQVKMKSSQHGTGLGIPLVFAHYAIKEIMKGSISFLIDKTESKVTILISLPFT